MVTLMTVLELSFRAKLTLPKQLTIGAGETPMGGFDLVSPIPAKSLGSGNPMCGLRALQAAIWQASVLLNQIIPNNQSPSFGGNGIFVVRITLDRVN